MDDYFRLTPAACRRFNLITINKMINNHENMSNGPFVRSAGAFVIYFLREKVCSTPESGHSEGSRRMSANDPKRTF